MVFFWGNCSTSSFLSFFSPTVWVIPCRKWVRRWDCTLDWLPPRLKCLPSTHLHLNSPAVTYYRMRQMDSRDEEREKRLKAFSFLSKSARCQVRMERCRNCRHSDLNYNSRISATSGMEADMILFCVTFFFFFLFSFIQAASAKAENNHQFTHVADTTSAFIWIRVSSHLRNVSLIFAQLFALFWSPPTLEGRYLFSENIRLLHLEMKSMGAVELGPHHSYTSLKDTTSNSANWNYIAGSWLSSSL